MGRLHHPQTVIGGRSANIRRAMTDFATRARVSLDAGWWVGLGPIEWDNGF
jgi:hypothetical protein